jgi:hypothetical protein
MLVEVDGGKLKTISGDKDNPDSQVSFACVAAAPTRFLGIRGDCCTPKFVMIAARISGAAAPCRSSSLSARVVEGACP